MVTFNKDTAHEELVKHALEKTAETGITEANKEQLKKALEEKATDGKLKIKIETEKELNKLKETIVTSLKVKKAAGLTETEIQETAKDIITESEKPETTTETASTAAPSPETPPVPVEGPTLIQFQAAIPVKAQEKIAEYKPNLASGIGNWIRDAIVNLIGGFLPEWAARFRGFANASVEKKAENAYNALTGDEGSNILSGSPLSDILVLDHINKNDFKKILAQYPNLDFSNKRNIEAAFLGKHADKPELIKYHRIYEGMRKMCAELSGPEGLNYNPEERLKKILSYSRDESIPVAYPDTVSASAMPETIAAAPMDPSSPEVQKDLMTKATEVDEALTKAQAMAEGTPEEKNTKTAAIKSAQEAVNTFKDQRKDNILSEYTSIKDRIKEDEIERNTLIQRNSPEESEKKKLTEVNRDLEKLRKIESVMKTKIEEVMIQKDNKWEIKEGINAQKMTSTGIAISAIENNTASVENQEVSKEEKEKQEKIIFDLEKEVEATLHGGSTDWKENYQIDRPEDLSELAKKITDAKKYANTDSLKDKISGMEKKIQTAKLKVDAVRAFLNHARGLVINEKEMPAYTSDPDDFIQFENGIIDINTEHAAGSWLPMSTWSDERWDLSDNETKIAEGLGGKSEFVNVIKANVNGLRNNEGLFSPKKGGDKFTILG